MHKSSFSRPGSREWLLLERAHAMRQAPTSTEAVLFAAVRGGRLGVSVRRQVPLLGRYIADLYVPAVRLVIEVDGGYHSERERADARRDQALHRAGYHVLRVASNEVMLDLASVTARIRRAIEALHQTR
jgi:very-short-patch-repair endonuclease